MKENLADTYNNSSLNKICRVIAILSILAFLATCSFATASELVAPQSQVLPNGLRVVIKPNSDGGLVAVNIVIRAGSAQDPEEAAGAAHFLEHMLFRGSKNYAAGAAQAEIESLGGAVNAGTLRDFTHIYATVPSAAFDRTMAALADTVINPLLPPAEVERERSVLLREIAALQEDARTMLWDLSHEMLFPDQPYAHPINGTVHSVFRMGRESLVAYHKRWYVPNNMAIIIVGDVDKESAMKVIDRHFAQLERKPVSRNTTPQRVNAEIEQQHIYYHSGRIAYVGLVAAAPSIKSPQQLCAMDILTSLLGEGRSSRLQSHLIESNPPLAISAGADFLTSRESSPFLIWAGCAPDKVDDVKRELEKEIDAIAIGPIPPDELVAARRRLETAFWLSNETYTDQADVLGFFEAIDTYRFAESYIFGVRAVTAAQVKAAARQYFAPEKRVWILLLPNENKEFARQEYRRE